MIDPVRQQLPPASAEVLKRRAILITLVLSTSGCSRQAVTNTPKLND